MGTRRGRREGAKEHDRLLGFRSRPMRRLSHHTVWRSVTTPLSYVGVEPIAALDQRKAQVKPYGGDRDYDIAMDCISSPGEISD